MNLQFYRNEIKAQAEGNLRRLLAIEQIKVRSTRIFTSGARAKSVWSKLKSAGSVLSEYFQKNCKFTLFIIFTY